MRSTRWEVDAGLAGGGGNGREGEPGEVAGLVEDVGFARFDRACGCPSCCCSRFGGDMASTEGAEAAVGISADEAAVEDEDGLDPFTDGATPDGMEDEDAEPDALPVS